MKPDLGELMKQARGMQEQMQKAQEALVNTEVTGEAGAGMIRVTMNGRHDVRRVQLDPSLLSEDKEMLEDLLAAAVNDAVRKVEEANREMLAGLTGGLQLPGGFKMPF